MADATDSKSVGGNFMWVRLPPPAPNICNKKSFLEVTFEDNKNARGKIVFDLLYSDVVKHYI